MTGTLWLNLGDSYAAGKCGRDDEDEESLRRRFEAYGTGRPKARGNGQHGKQRQAPEGLKPKDLVGIPWRVAFALQADGWWLRSDIIWSKPNPMPESVTDRPTKAHEYVFLLAKSERYYFDADAVREPMSEESAGRYRYAFGGPKADALIEANEHGVGQRTMVRGMREPGGLTGGAYAPPGQAPHSNARTEKAVLRANPPNRADSGGVGAPALFRNVRSVWRIATAPFAEAHFATFPPELAERCILAGCPKGGTVLDPFAGAGTAGLVADRLGRDFIGFELNPKYVEMAERRIRDDAPLFAEVTTA